MADVVLKQGDTLVAECAYRDAADIPVNLTTAGITIDSAVMKADGTGRIDLDVVIDADQVLNPGEFRIEEDTSAWPTGNLLWDIRYYQNGRSFSSRTMTLVLNERVT